MIASRMNTGIFLASVVAMSVSGASLSFAQESTGDDLSITQARLADRYERLELVATRLAELSAATDPGRAKLLREAIARSRELDVSVRFEAIVALLESERLAAAARNQGELHNELQQLLDLLLTDTRHEELESRQRRIRKYLREVGRLIRWQKGIRARTKLGDELETLGRDQEQAADETGRVADQIDETEGHQTAGSESASENEGAESSESSESSESNEGGAQGENGEPSGKSSDGSPSGSQGQPSQPSQPSPGQPGGQSPGGQPSEGDQGSQGQRQDQQSAEQDPSDRAASRLQAAEERMRRAQEKLEQTQRDEATEAQEEALSELEQARAELERILRQLREEELEQVLTRLAARFRKMLDAQVQVYEATVQLDEIPSDQRSHREEIEAARLSRQELLILRDADKALVLLREEGSSVAFPEALEQLSEDMQEVAERLAEVNVGVLTQGIEEDIIVGLEEALSALDKALGDLEKNRTPPGQMPPGGSPTEPPLVDKIAELKMIRSLQLRINRRTERYGNMLDTEQALEAELVQALRQLSLRQDRVYEATKDLSLGKNE